MRKKKTLPEMKFDVEKFLLTETPILTVQQMKTLGYYTNWLSSRSYLGIIQALYMKSYQDKITSSIHHAVDELDPLKIRGLLTLLLQSVEEVHEKSSPHLLNHVYSHLEMIDTFGETEEDFAKHIYQHLWMTFENIEKVMAKLSGIPFVDMEALMEYVDECDPETTPKIFHSWMRLHAMLMNLYRGLCCQNCRLSITDEIEAHLKKMGIEISEETKITFYQAWITCTPFLLDVFYFVDYFINTLSQGDKEGELKKEDFQYLHDIIDATEEKTEEDEARRDKFKCACLDLVEILYDLRNHYLYLNQQEEPIVIQNTSSYLN